MPCALVRKVTTSSALLQVVVVAVATHGVSVTQPPCCACALRGSKTSTLTPTGPAQTEPRSCVPHLQLTPLVVPVRDLLQSRCCCAEPRPQRTLWWPWAGLRRGAAKSQAARQVAPRCCQGGARRRAGPR
jgi:hypothetical protein